MSLAKKYNIPEETVQQMVRNGVISCSVLRAHEIFDHYLMFKGSAQAQGMSNNDIFIELSRQLNVNESTVKNIVWRLGKNL